MNTLEKSDAELQKLYQETADEFSGGVEFLTKLSATLTGPASDHLKIVADRWRYFAEIYDMAASFRPQPVEVTYKRKAKKGRRND